MQNSKKINSWPKIFIQPKYLIIAITLWLCFAWFLWIASDISGLFIPDTNLWPKLFNEYPVEWTQWYILGFAILTGGYISGRISAENSEDKYKEMAKFFLIFSIGLALMLVEEAGDVRHAISREVRDISTNPFIRRYVTIFVDVPYFAMLSVIPVYSIIRYQKAILKTVQTKYYLAVGACLYALAAVGSGFRHFQDSYVVMGRIVDTVVFRGNFPVDRYDQNLAHFFLIDSIIEESIELIAATMMLAMMLAFIHEYKKYQKGKDQ